MTFKCIESLEENPTEVYLEVSSILIKLVDNVLHYPSNPKYRKLRLENKLVSSIILPSIGAMECLFEMGFQEGDDALLLPPEKTSIEKLTRFREEISIRRNKYLKEHPNGNVTGEDQNGKREQISSNRQSTPQPEAAASVPPPTAVNANHFLEQLQNYSSVVLQYEEEATKRKALSVIPVDKISERVQKCMRQHQQVALKNSEPLDEASLQEALFIRELMNWFKNDFFEWVNSPKCESCKCDSQFLEMSSDPKELVQSPRVEVYKCGVCSSRILFPRINDVRKLLDTRKGRCGEWANAFTALCRALGFETRYVYDATDHVWTEVYFKSQQRWVHCDACECVLDKPLLYEKGWGKKLTYVIGFSCDGAQDVTWRYSAHHDAVRARRNLCTEEQLVQTLCRINQLRQANMSAARKKLIARRTVIELVELMIPAKETEGDNQGRQSGSLAWRLARHETTLQLAEKTPYVWTPTKQEVEAKKMVISYCASRDHYLRAGGEMEKGWNSRTFSAENVFRKEEKDWKTVYLCRTEGSVEGKVSWRVDVTDSGLRIGRVEVKCPSTTYHSGTVVWTLCSDDTCVPITNGELQTTQLSGATVVTLTATLSGGEGDVAWQHAQLFRQPLDSPEVALQLSVSLVST